MLPPNLPFLVRSLNFAHKGKLRNHLNTTKFVKRLRPLRVYKESVSEQRNINFVAGFSFLFVTRESCCGKTVRIFSLTPHQSNLTCIPNCLPVVATLNQSIVKVVKNDNDPTFYFKYFYKLVSHSQP